MKTPFHFLLIFALFLIPEFISAQCDSGVPASEFLKSLDEEILLIQINKLEKCSTKKDTLAMTHRRLGVAYYHVAGDIEKAIFHTTTAMEMGEAIPSYDKKLLGLSYHNLGVFYKKLYQYYKAEDYFKKGIQTFRLINHPKEIEGYRELAIITREKGDLNRAIQYINTAIERSIIIQNFYALAKCKHEYGLILNDKGDFKNALILLKEADVIYDTISIKKSSFIYNKAASNLSIAQTYDDLGRFNEALIHYQTALDYFRKSQRLTQEIWCLISIGVTYKKLDHFKKSISYLKDALDRSQEIKDPPTLATIHDNLADVYLQENNYKKALDHYHFSLHYLIPELDKNDITQNPRVEDLKNSKEKVYLLTILADKANAWKTYFQTNPNKEFLNHALANYRLADGLLDAMRYEHNSEQSKLFWRQKTKELYESAIDMCVLLDKKEEAFHFIEKGKSVLLYDALQNKLARTVLPLELADKEFELLRKTKDDPGNLDAQSNLNDFINQLIQDYPLYHQLRYNFEVVSVQNVQDQLLNDSTYVVEYFLGEKNIYAFLISKNETRLESIPRKKYIDDLYQKVRMQLVGKNEFEMETAHQLFQEIYAKVWENGTPSKGEVIVIPDGFLGYIPFDALVYQNRKSGKLEHLIYRQMFRYAYSATTLLKHQEKQKFSKIENGFEILALAPFTEGRRGQAALYGSREELENISERYVGKYFYNQEATSLVFRAAAEDYPVIHLSTHASADEGEQEPRIEFSDTSFYLSELYLMNLKSELIVLRSCETGMGEIAKGEGVLSLSRGFMYAGANSLIFSLWRIKENASETILSIFYEKLEKKYSRAKALHLAKLEYLQNVESDLDKAPHLWAGLNFIGADGELPLKKKRKHLVWVILGGGLLLGSVYFFRK